MIIQLIGWFFTALAVAGMLSILIVVAGCLGALVVIAWKSVGEVRKSYDDTEA